MKHIPIVVFFVVFVGIYGLLNYYILLRGWQAIPQDFPFRMPLLILFIGIASTLVVGRVLERFWISPLSAGLVWIASFWLGAMLYLFLAVVLLDLSRVILPLFPALSNSVAAAYPSVKLWTLAGVVTLVCGLLTAGFINARTPAVKKLDITVDKPLPSGRVTLAVASDIHLGTIIGNGRLRSIVETINGLHPDIILLPGDIVDEDLGPVIAANLGEQLRALQAPLGVFAVTGNHEYIGGAEEAVSYLQSHGVTMLRDSAIQLPGGLVVAGREDRNMTTFAGKRRKPLQEILASVGISGPTVLMDHQPFQLEEAEQAGVDLQLSGHTHHGQLWPLNFITQAIYERSWGYLVKGRTQYYVSCGVGTWGPPVRLGNRPEIILVTLYSSR